MPPFREGELNSDGKVSPGALLLRGGGNPPFLNMIIFPVREGGVEFRQIQINSPQADPNRAKSNQIKRNREKIKPNQVGEGTPFINMIIFHVKEGRVESRRIQITSPEQEPNQGKSRRIDSNQVKSSQITSDQVKSSQIKSN